MDALHHTWTLMQLGVFVSLLGVSQNRVPRPFSKLERRAGYDIVCQAMDPSARLPSMMEPLQKKAGDVVDPNLFSGIWWLQFGWPGRLLPVQTIEVFGINAALQDGTGTEHRMLS